MAIVTNDYVDYNEDEHFYFLTEAGIDEYTGYGYLGTIWKNPKLRLQKMARALHSLYTDNFHNNKPIRSKHKDLIHYNVFKNERGERQAIINALAYMIELEEDSDWFTRYLIGEVEQFPKSITNMLKQANVLVYGSMIGSVPEDEFEVDY